MDGRVTRLVTVSVFLCGVLSVCPQATADETPTAGSAECLRRDLGCGNQDLEDDGEQERRSQRNRRELAKFVKAEAERRKQPNDEYECAVLVIGQSVGRKAE